MLQRTQCGVSPSSRPRDESEWQRWQCRCRISETIVYKEIVQFFDMHPVQYFLIAVTLISCDRLFSDVIYTRLAKEVWRQLHSKPLCKRDEALHLHNDRVISTSGSWPPSWIFSKQVNLGAATRHTVKMKVRPRKCISSRYDGDVDFWPLTLKPFQQWPSLARWWQVSLKSVY